MASPFPGMDPFLEHPAYFPDLHGSLVYCIREALQAKLPEPYYAVLNERLWVETEKPRHIEPDVDILKPTDHGNQKGSGRAAVATLTRTEPLVVPIYTDEHRETCIDIATRSGDVEAIVTTIELLSITNKTPGEKGRNLYLQKQAEVVDANINLVEIDLLRGGTHATLAPRGVIQQAAGPFDYHVCVHVADDFVNAQLYTFRLEQAMPEIRIPLLPGDKLVPLDLQAVFDRCYDAGPYRRRVRYDPARIEPPLSPERTEWVRRILAEKGLLAATEAAPHN